MSDRSRHRNISRGIPRLGRMRRSRDRSPPRLRSPILRERGRPRFERIRSRERFRSRERSPRFERGRSNERFDLPHELMDDPGRFEPPPREMFERARSFENERYMPPQLRFEERSNIEPIMIEKNINFDCPADYGKFRRPSVERYDDIPPVNVEINQRIIPPSAREVSPPFITSVKEEVGDKPDPWTSSSTPAVSTSQLQPTFGQEKGSNLIPEFDPEKSDINVNTFLRLIDKVGQEKEWSGHERKSQFSLKLRGSAKDWFINGNKFLESWSSIKKQFRSSFPADMDYYFTLTNMLQRTKRLDEDMSTYFNYKIVLLKNCNITGRKAVSCLIGGLPDTLQDLKTNASDKNFATAEELYKYLIDENIDGSGSNETKCNVCGKRGNCECHKTENKQTLAEESLSRIKPVKCYKDIYISGKVLKCLFDENFPHNTIRESDVDFLKIRYRRQIARINGYERTSLTSLGMTQIMIRVDDLFTEMTFYVIKDTLQDTPVVLGRTAIKYPHITTRKGVFFTAEPKPVDFEDRHDVREHQPIEIRRSRSPGRRNTLDHELPLRRGSPGDRGINRSPSRRSPPGRLYKDSALFINQFYGNPYA